MSAVDPGFLRIAAVRASGLEGGFGSGLDGAGAALVHLSAVQLDTISVVERAHHHILWSRLPSYRPSLLEGLEAEPRRAFEYWSHAAAYLPLGEYRFCLPRMRRIAKEGHDWFPYDAAVARRILARIRAEGPLQVRDFEGPRRSGAGWWDWKPAKVALEYLFHAGRLASLGRVGFQKVYDLPERVLPPDLDLSLPSSREMAGYYLDVAQRTLGVFRAKDLAYGRKDGLGGLEAALASRCREGRLLDLGSGTFAAVGALEAAGASAGGRPRAWILSPFDPLVIDRRRLRELFGFDYTLECYVPEAKRRFGYFGLPLLCRSASGDYGFLGLLDAKADRAKSVLEVRRLGLPGLSGRGQEGKVLALARELRRFAAFNGCRGIHLGRVEAEAEVAGVKALLAEALP